MLTRQDIYLLAYIHSKQDIIFNICHNNRLGFIELTHL